MSEFYPNFYLRDFKKKLLPGINALTSEGLSQHEKFLFAFHENNITEAKKELKGIKKRGGSLSDRNYYLLMGCLCITENSLDEAVIHLKTGLSLFPKDVELMGVLANAYSGKGKRSEAIHLYEEALKINPHYFPALTDLAHYYTEIGEHDKALKLIDSAIEISGDNPIILSSKAKILRDMGQANNAIDVFKLVLDLDPNDRDSLINIGNCFFSQNEYLESIRYYDKALGVSPFYKDSLLMKIQALIGLKKFSAAKKLLELCTDKNPKSLTKTERKFFVRMLLWEKVKFYMVEKPIKIVLNHPFTAVIISILLTVIGWLFFG